MICLRSSSTPRRHVPADRSRTGAAMVEMALVLPIFVTVMFGIVELGRAFMVGQLITNAAREGARMSILDGSTNAQVETAVKNFLSSAANASASDVTVTIVVNNPAAGNLVSKAETGNLITVTATVPFTKVSFLPPMFLGSNSLRGQCTMQHE